MTCWQAEGDPAIVAAVTQGWRTLVFFVNVAGLTFEADMRPFGRNAGRLVLVDVFVDQGESGASEERAHQQDEEKKRNRCAVNYGGTTIHGKSGPLGSGG